MVETVGRKGAVKFFREQAGYSYDPKTQTEEEGREECARELAKAEQWEWDEGYTFDWEEDDIPFECACDNPDCESHEPHTAYVCIMRTPAGASCQSLCGISFGPGVEPWGQAYKRVVEAELASEQMADAGY